MVQGQVLLKREVRTLFLFNFFKVYRSFLHLEIILLFAKLCYTFEEKVFLSATIILWKKVILSCIKINLCVCLSKVGVSVRAGRVLSAWKWRNCLKHLKKEWNRKEGRRNKNVIKGRRQAGSRVGCLKKGGGGGGGARTPLRTRTKRVRRIEGETLSVKQVNISSSSIQLLS